MCKKTQTDSMTNKAVSCSPCHKPSRLSSAQRRSQDFCLGGATRYIFGHLSGEPTAFSGGGGVVAEIFRVTSFAGSYSVGGGVVAEFFRGIVCRITFSGGGG